MNDSAKPAGQRAGALNNAPSDIAVLHALFEVLAGVPQATLATDGNGTVIAANHQVEVLFGYRTDELMGEPIEKLIPDRARENHRELRSKHARSRRSRLMAPGIDIFGLDRFGYEIPLEITLCEIDIGSLALTLCFARSLADQRRFESRLAQSQKMEAVGQLAGGIAHDFNNLLGIVIGNLQVLGEPTRPREDGYYVNEALGGALRAADLTKRLLAFSKRQLLAPEIVDVNSLINDLSGLLVGSLRDDIEMHKELSPILWSAHVDPGQLENALVNLALNARDAMPSGGRLTVTTSNEVLDARQTARLDDVAAGDYVAICVEDDGSGIPSRVLADVFEPFFSTKKGDNGSGLGLSMVYGFIKQSHGHITIDSEVNRGTRVTMYLPRARQQRANLPETTATWLSIPSGSETILLVDSDTSLRRVTATLLSALGYTVLEADRGDAALQILTESRGEVDLLFTDIMLPGRITGIELGRRAEEIRPGIRMLYASRFGDTATLDARIIEDCEHLLSKPYQKHQLAQTIRGVLDSE